MIFISYRHKGPAHAAGRLRENLERRFPSNSIYQDAHFKLGKIEDQINDALEKCDLLVAIVGHGWGDEFGIREKQSSSEIDHVRAELAYAVKNKLTIYPILVDGAPMPSADEMPSDIAEFVKWRGDPLNHLTSDQNIATIVEKIVSFIKPDDVRPVETDKQSMIEANVTLAIGMLKESRVDEAAETLDAVLAKEPRHSRALMQRGGVEFARFNCKLALSYFQKAVQADEGNAEALAWRGAAHKFFKNAEQARADTDLAIALDPQNATAYAVRSMTHCLGADVSRAKKDAEKAMALDPALDVGFLACAVAYLLNDEAERAIVYADQAVSLNDRNYENHAVRGVVLSGLEQWDGAIESLDCAIGLFDGDPNNYASRAFAHHQIGDLDQALIDSSTAIAKPTADADCFNTHALILNSLEDYQGALNAYSNAVSLDPNNVDHLHTRAWFFLGLRHVDDAIDDYLEAEKMDPEHEELAELASAIRSIQDEAAAS